MVMEVFPMTEPDLEEMAYAALDLSLADCEAAIARFDERAGLAPLGAVWAALAELLRAAGVRHEGYLLLRAEGPTRIARSTQVDSLQFHVGDVVEAVLALPVASRPVFAAAFMAADVGAWHDLFAAVAAVAVTAGW